MSQTLSLIGTESRQLSPQLSSLELRTSLYIVSSSCSSCSSLFSHFLTKKHLFIPYVMIIIDTMAVIKIKGFMAKSAKSPF